MHATLGTSRSPVPPFPLDGRTRLLVRMAENEKALAGGSVPARGLPIDYSRPASVGPRFHKTRAVRLACTTSPSTCPTAGNGGPLLVKTYGSPESLMAAPR